MDRVGYSMYIFLASRRRVLHQITPCKLYLISGWWLACTEVTISAHILPMMDFIERHTYCWMSLVCSRDADVVPRPALERLDLTRSFNYSRPSLSDSSMYWQLPQPPSRIMTPSGNDSVRNQTVTSRRKVVMLIWQFPGLASWVASRFSVPLGWYRFWTKEHSNAVLTGVSSDSNRGDSNR